MATLTWSVNNLDSAAGFYRNTTSAARRGGAI